MREQAMSNIDLYKIPVEALRPFTLGQLSGMLNKHKILPSPEPLRLPRDYRGIAHLMDINLIAVGLEQNPIDKLLRELGPRKKLTLGQLQSYFEKIDRYDVLDYTKEMFYDDAVEFETKKSGLVQRQPSLNTFSNNYEVLTIDDIIRNQNGDKDPQNYDVFILYTNEDSIFAEHIRNKMENDLKLKVCDKDRDLAPGVTFLHAAIMELISMRCNWLFVILSNEFLNSDRHQFFVKFAQGIFFEQGRRGKVIPCTYKECILPIEYSSYVRADYQRDIANGSFWKKLQYCLAPSTNVPHKNLEEDASTGVSIEEIALEDVDPVPPIKLNWLQLSFRKIRISIRMVIKKPQSVTRKTHKH